MDTNISSLLGALYRRKLVILLVLGGSIGGGMYFEKNVPKTYLARATMFIPMESTRLSLNNEGNNIPMGPVTPDFSEGTRVGLMGLINSGAVFDRVAELVPDVDIKKLRRNMIADIDSYQQLSAVVYDRDPQAAILLANAFVDAVRDEIREMAETAPRATLAAFEAEAPQAWELYQEARQALVDQLETLGSPDLENEIQILLQQRRAVESSLEDLELDEQRLIAEQQAVAVLLAERPEWQLSRRNYALNPVFRSLQDQVQTLESDLAVQRLVYTPEHPVVKDLLTRLSLARQRAAELADKELELIHSSSTETLDEQARNLNARLVDNELSRVAVEPKRTVLQERLTAIQGRLTEFPINMTEIERLNGDVERHRKYADDIERRMAEIRLQLERGLEFTYSDKFRMADEEDVKPVPTSTGIILFTSVAGLIAGLALALGMELLDQARRRFPY
ncbi:MAG: hypothetical protein DWQ01_10820 [Planctomycetota bacterium]|nr:MAG: hypothetical protein DWQ01_10820 [Planctomycetota bacterium]